MNFFPCRSQFMSQAISVEIAGVESSSMSFQSEYSLSQRYLSHLRLNYNVRHYTRKLFKPTLQELQKVNGQLTVNFSLLYEEWNQKINSPLLQRFINKESWSQPNQNDVNQDSLDEQSADSETETKLLKSQQEMGEQLLLSRQSPSYKFDNEKVVELHRQIVSFYPQLTVEKCKKLIEGAIMFQNDSNAMQMLNGEEVSEKLNLRLAWFVFSKLNQNRKRLESIVGGLLRRLLQSQLPYEVRYVLSEFKKTATHRFGRLSVSDVRNFFNKIVVSHTLFASLVQQHNESGSLPQKDRNLLNVVLWSQKVLFSQLQSQNNKSLQRLIEQFDVDSFVSRSFGCTDAEEDNPVDCVLMSIATVGYLYKGLRTQNLIVQLPLIEKVIQQPTVENYPLQSVFVILNKQQPPSYDMCLYPDDRVQESLINFLLLVPQCSVSTSKQMLVEEHRCSLHSSSQIRLYAEFLNMHPTQDAEKAINSVLDKVLIEIESNKIRLETQFLFATNLSRELEERATLIAVDITTVVVKRVLSQWQLLISQRLNAVTLFYQRKSNEAGEQYKSFVKDMIQRVLKTVDKSFKPEIVEQAVQEILGAQLLQKVSPFFPTDPVFEESLKKHQFVNGTMMGIALPSLEVDFILDQAVDRIQEFIQPHGAEKLLQTLFHTTSTFSEIVGITAKASDVTSDLQIPLMLLTVLRSRIEHFPALLSFVEEFNCKETGSSVMGLTLTLSRSALYLVSTLDAHSLNLSQSEYLALLPSQYRNTKCNTPIQQEIKEQGNPVYQKNLNRNLFNADLKKQSKLIERLPPQTSIGNEFPIEEIIAQISSQRNSIPN